MLQLQLASFRKRLSLNGDIYGEHCNTTLPEPLHPISKKAVSMAKSQKKSNKEAKKPKAPKVKTNASNPSTKPGIVSGLEHLKR